MFDERRLSELLRSRKRGDAASRANLGQEFIVSITPAGVLFCKVVNGQTGQSRPITFGRSETISSTNKLFTSRIVAEPEGNPTGISLAGFPADADANLSVFFFGHGAVSGDMLIYQKEDGTNLHVQLFAFVEDNPVQVLNTTVADNLEHSETIQIPIS